MINIFILTFCMNRCSKMDCFYPFLAVLVFQELYEQVSALTAISSNISSVKIIYKQQMSSAIYNFYSLN